MACETCDHTMQGLTSNGSVHWFWCPRCGSIKQETDGGHQQTEPPKLVLRCREFCNKHVGLTGAISTAWYRLGIGEAINPPGKR